MFEHVRKIKLLKNKVRDFLYFSMFFLFFLFYVMRPGLTQWSFQSFYALVLFWLRFAKAPLLFRSFRSFRSSFLEKHSVILPSCGRQK